MKKAVFAVVLPIFLAACFPLTPAPAPRPVLDSAGTAEAALKTAVIQTLTAQSTNSPAPLIESPTPAIPTDTPPSPSATVSTPATVDPNLLAATKTFEAAIATSTGFPTDLPVGPATATFTPSVLTYGTLPPAVPFSNITLVNRSKAQAYISLQVITAQGGPTIMEYPVSGKIKIQAPVGNYLYVAWVGGRKMVGEFKLHKDQDLEIRLYRDRVEIR